MNYARRYAVWPEPRSRSRSLKGSRPSVPHGTNILSLVFIAMCSVFWLFWLIYQYLPSDWLERLLRKPNCCEDIVPRKPRPKSVHDFLGLLYCFIVLLCICVVSCPYMIYYPTVMARYSLFVLKVPLNPSKQTNKQISLTPIVCVVDCQILKRRMGQSLAWPMQEHSCPST